ncbi:MAG: hypothetical protein K0R12_1201 [Gammaproteobacteria bacterium]|jgi:hypothetical protein|nr:hypothetical protein [Gammaproteobacteria bacterium]
MDERHRNIDIIFCIAAFSFLTAILLLCYEDFIMLYKRNVIDVMKYCHNRSERTLQSLMRSLDNAHFHCKPRAQEVIHGIKKKIIADFKKPKNEQVGDEIYLEWQATLNKAIQEDILQDLIHVLRKNGRYIVRSRKACYWIAFIIKFQRSRNGLDANSPLNSRLKEAQNAYNGLCEEYLSVLDEFKVYLPDEFEDYMQEYKQWLMSEIKKTWTEKSSYKTYKARFKDIKKFLKLKIKGRIA